MSYNLVINGNNVVNSTLKWACLPNLPEGFCKNSLPHRSQPKYAQFQSVGIKDKLNTRALQLAQLTPPS